MKYGTVKAIGIACGVGQVAAHCEAGSRAIGGVPRVNRGAHPSIGATRARMVGAFMMCWTKTQASGPRARGWLVLSNASRGVPFNWAHTREDGWFARFTLGPRVIGCLEDLENLRRWQNEHKEAFSRKEDITEFEQMLWFGEYKKRSTDCMFMVVVDGVSIGCMGFRMKYPWWDIYNVICGDEKYLGKGYMGKAFRMMEAYATSLVPVCICADVLKDNTAVQWYLEQGYYHYEEHDGYFRLAHADAKALLKESDKLKIERVE